MKEGVSGAVDRKSVRGGVYVGIERGRGVMGKENERDGFVHSLALTRRETKDAERP